jgi:hypothetical protein
MAISIQTKETANIPVIVAMKAAEVTVAEVAAEEEVTMTLPSQPWKSFVGAIPLSSRQNRRRRLPVRPHRMVRNYRVIRYIPSPAI